MKKNLKKILSVILSIIMVSSVLIVGSVSVTALDNENDEYEIVNDGYGYLTANFPSVYPKEYVQDPAALSEQEIWEKVEAVLNTMTLAEKIEALHGGGNTAHSYGTGVWRGVARVGVPIIRNYDGPMGVRGNTGEETTKPPNEISITSSFDVDAAYEYGALYAVENTANNGNMQLGDQVDIVRQLSTSRARDMFGEDWYLSGEISEAVTKGLQDNNVIACLKHLGGFGNIDEQTMHETYLSGVRAAMIDGGAGSIMTNYNSVNGVTACANTYILKNILRDMWGYEGIVLTDWGGNYEFTTDNGVTMETPSGSHNNAQNVNNALNSGLITEADIDVAVGYNLYAVAKAGYFGLVQISRDGGVATDDTPPDVIDLPGTTGAEREEILVENEAKAIELAQKGAVLLKNEGNVLPLSKDKKVAMIGFGATNNVAGHQHECSFGQLKGLSVSPFDAMQALYPDYDAAGYVANDIEGVAIPADVLYQDRAASTAGVVRTGTDGNGEEYNGVDANINFVTNSTTYKNAADGTAFPYGTQGANYTWTTYLKAPETGAYTIKIEGIAATSISGKLYELDAEAEEETVTKETGIKAAGGNTGVGTFGNTSVVCSDTGLDIPTTGSGGGGGGWGPGGPGGPGGGGGGSSTTSEFNLEAGKVYKITVSANGAYTGNNAHQAGIKDMQVRLAWITPSQKTNDYSSAIAAASAENTTVVLFAYSLESLSLDNTQRTLLTDAIAAAKEAGNKIVLVINSALPVDITSFEPDVDAVLEMWLPGDGGGTATANILTGAYNPSGKLCVAWPTNSNQDQREISTNGRRIKTGIPAGGPGGGVAQFEVKEGIFNGYKWYDAADKQDQVVWDFGFGLSYTDFEYQLVSIVPDATGADEYGYDVNVKVTNTGSAAGSDAPQVYLAAADLENGIYSPYDVASSWRYVDADGNPTTDYDDAEYFPLIDGVQMAPVQIAAFAQTGVLEPGDSTVVTMHVDQRSLAYWDVSIADEDMYERSDGTKDKWTVPEGNRTFYIGKSSDDLVITRVVNVEPAEYDGTVAVKAPASANVNETFKITVTTGTDVIGLKVLNEKGTPITIKDLSKTYGAGGKVTWDVYVAIGTAGEGRELSVVTKTFDGWAEEPAVVTIDIVNPPVEALYAWFDSEIVYKNDPVDAYVTTSASAKKVVSYNENNIKMGMKQVAKSTNWDGTIEWVFTMSFGTKGLGKIYTFKAAGADGEFGVSAARAAINVL